MQIKMQNFYTGIGNLLIIQCLFVSLNCILRIIFVSQIILKNFENFHSLSVYFISVKICLRIYNSYAGLLHFRFLTKISNIASNYIM